MLVDFSCEIKIPIDAGFLAVMLYGINGILKILIVGTVDFQRLLFGSFGGISPVTLWRFFHAEYIRNLPAAYPYLLEVAASIMVGQRIDSEYLLFLHICKAEDARDVIITVFKFALVKQYLDI